MSRKRPPQAQAIGLTAQDIKNVMRTEFDHYLSDIEWRVKQAYEVSRRPLDARAMNLSDKQIDQYSEHAPVMVQGSVYAEDMNTLQHHITGYTVTANTPTSPQFTWASLHIVYGGTDYTVADGSAAAADYYLWFNKSLATGTAPNMNVAMAKLPITSKPPLATGDAIIFINNAGVPISMLEQNLPRVLADNAVDVNALQSKVVSGAKIADNTIGTGQIALNAAITGTQIAANANLAGSQLAAGANIAGSQLAPNAGLVGAQLAGGTIGSTQLGQGAVSTSKLSILEHVLY